MDLLKTDYPIAIQGVIQSNGKLVKWKRGSDLIVNGETILITPSFQEVINFLSELNIAFESGTVTFRNNDNSTSYTRALLNWCIEWEKARWRVIKNARKI